MKYPRVVYAIQHNKTKKIYIGSSSDVENRYKNHMCELRNSKHRVEDLQKDFNEHGEDFSLFILDTINNRKENKKEYDWMRHYNSFERGYGYNYHDNTRKKIFSTQVPYREGTPEAHEDVRFSQQTKERYISEIVEEMNSCTDVPFLRIILNSLRENNKAGEDAETAV